VACLEAAKGGGSGRLPDGSAMEAPTKTRAEQQLLLLQDAVLTCTQLSALDIPRI